MRKFILLLSICKIISLEAQELGKVFDFSNGSSSDWISGSSLLAHSNVGGTIKIAANKVGPSSEISYFFFTATPQNLTPLPYVSFKIKTAKPITLRVDLIDKSGLITNATPILREIKELNAWTEITLNFTGLFRQVTPSNGNLESGNIQGIGFYINPNGTSFTGDVFIDDVAFGNKAVRSIGNGIPGVKVDQLGFYPNGSKVAIASSTSKTTFSLVNTLNQTVYTGNLGIMKYFEAAQDSVKVADFTNFTVTGRYKVVVEGIPASSFFDIKEQVKREVAKAAIKYFYYNRASIALDSRHAGIWSRSAGHLDNTVYIHPSAATTLRPANTIVSAPKGWYDAGDYNKYVVNSGISTYTLMALYERFSPIYDTLNLNIPESSNLAPDLLDEVKWNLDWMLAMQDPNDGGVYFKLTTKGFGGDVMPNQDNAQRFMVGKSTTSALNYAATMAMAYRIFKPFNSQLNGFADTCILRSYRAYRWAKSNPRVGFSNPSDVVTGGYGDGDYSDEFSWAATELYIASQDDIFYNDINLSINSGVPSWNSTYTLALMSLCHNRANLTPIANQTTILNKFRNVVNDLKTNFLNTAYRMPMNSVNNDYYWGSNGVASNQAMVLLQDYYNTGDLKSYEAAQANLEYILGRNPLEFCFVTGFGTQTPKFPHHRPSVADGVLAPVPGMLVGGPNDNSENEFGCTYKSKNAALEYTDQICSYSTNEIAINWNAPFAFITGAIEAKNRGVSPTFKYFEKGYPVAIEKQNVYTKIEVFPNPTSGKFSIELPLDFGIESLEIYTSNGVFIESFIDLKSVDLSNYKNGLYIVNILSEKGVFSKQIAVQR